MVETKKFLTPIFPELPLSAIYNEGTNKFDISVGKEICYNIECNLSEIPYTDFDRIDFEYLKRGFYYE